MTLAREIKAKMKRGEASIGSWMSLGHPSIGEILAGAGYEWVVVDTEHTAIDVSEVLRLIMGIEQGGAVPLVRLAGNDPIQAKAVLDSGAAGVLVPTVNTREEAELAVRMTKYPPAGFRGVGLARAQGYGERFDEYVANANADSLLLVMIEQKEGVANIEEILSVEGIDGTFIGPYDLSLSLGLPGQLRHPRVLEAKTRVKEATLARGLIAGAHVVQPATAEEECARAIAEGYRFIAVSSDLLLLSHGARSLQRAIVSG